jgi:hypothetical protein
VDQTTVVIEIYSGRPDPMWTLGPHQMVELRRRLTELKPSGDRALPPEPGLGYRGLHVSIADGDHGHVVQVRSGKVAYGGRILRDDGRALERWLLSTAPPELAPLAKSVAESLR